jgi:hypothetical protein
MFNPVNLFKLKGIWEGFSKRHPKVVSFGTAVYPEAIEAGTILEATVTRPDGKTYQTTMKISEADMDMVRELETIFGQEKNPSQN